MIDTTVSLEVAKLAKEKGFDWPTIAFHVRLEEPISYTFPTQSLLAKWLREKGIHVWVYPHIGTEVWYTGSIWEIGKQIRELNNFDPSYERVLEEALKESLSLL